MGGSTGFVSEQYASVQMPTQNAQPMQNAQPTQNPQPVQDEQTSSGESNVEPEIQQTEATTQEAATDNTDNIADSSVQDSDDSK